MEQVSLGNQRAVFTDEKLKEAWLEFSKIHSEDKVMLSQVMDQHKPVLNPDGESYVVTVFNEFQEKKIQEVAFDLATFLRTKLQNSRIRMKILVDESKDDKQFFTTTDKLKLMVETNPDLNLLRKTFGLDLE